MKNNTQKEAEEKISKIEESKEESKEESAKSAKNKEVPVNGSFRFNQKNKF